MSFRIPVVNDLQSGSDSFFGYSWFLSRVERSLILTKLTWNLFQVLIFVPFLKQPDPIKHYKVMPPDIFWRTCVFCFICPIDVSFLIWFEQDLHRTCIINRYRFLYWNSLIPLYITELCLLIGTNGHILFLVLYALSWFYFLFYFNKYWPSVHFSSFLKLTWFSFWLEGKTLIKRQKNGIFV